MLISEVPVLGKFSSSGYTLKTKYLSDHCMTSHIMLRHCEFSFGVAEVICYTISAILLAHLSQRLIGELIGYSWSGVRPSSVVVRPS